MAAAQVSAHHAPSALRDQISSSTQSDCLCRTSPARNGRTGAAGISRCAAQSSSRGTQGLIHPSSSSPWSLGGACCRFQSAEVLSPFGFLYGSAFRSLHAVQAETRCCDWTSLMRNAGAVQSAAECQPVQGAVDAAAEGDGAHDAGGGRRSRVGICPSMTWLNLNKVCQQSLIVLCRFPVKYARSSNPR